LATWAEADSRVLDIVPRSSTDASLAAIPPRTAARDERRQRRLVLVVVHALDVLAIVVSGLAITVAGYGAQGAGAVLAVLVLIPAVFCGGDAPTQLTLRALDELPRVFGWVGVCLLIAVPVGVVTGSGDGLLAQAAVTAVAICIGRGASYAVVRHLRRSGRLRSRAVIVGAGVVGTEIDRVVRQHPELGVDVVGFVDTPVQSGPPVLGDVDAIESILERHQARRVIVAFGLRREAELVDLLRRLSLLDLDVHVVPRFFDIGVAPSQQRGVDDIWGVPLYHLPRAGLRRPAWLAKRVIDITLASTILLLSLPVLLVLAVIVRIGSPGHPLFRQIRIGRDGRSFQLLKLRSLRTPSPEPEPETVIDLRSEHEQDDLTIQMGRSADVDQRSTWVGGFVRRTCLDEVPQLWNVLTGDMSLVGPRPEEAQFASRFAETVPGYRQRHRVPGGLTGWAQVHGLRGQTSIVERARFDNQYIEHWSLWNDIAIMLRTVGAIGRSALGRSLPATQPTSNQAG
jgi:exopolysaccharide biosynthesis polyprenyl glycosylphosphotransferase